MEMILSMRYAQLFFVLSSFVSAQCDIGSVELNINAGQTSGTYDGSEINPYSSIMEAFDAQIANTSGTSTGTSFCLKLWQNSNHFELDATGYSEDFAQMLPKSTTTKIHMISWDQASSEPSTTNVLIYYMDPSVVWKIQHEWELSFSYVTIRSDKMVDPNWASELCRHCHYADALADSRYTGTGEDFHSLSKDDQNKLTLGGTTCTDKTVSYAVRNGPNSDDMTYYIDSGTQHSWGFVNVAYSGGILRMSNCLFTEFRFRPTYLINSSNGGSVYLTNVDFVNVEPSQYHHQDATDIEGLDNAPIGIITSFQVLDEDEVTDVEFWGCSFDANPEGQYPLDAPKACGELIWNGGTVTGLNKDVNVFEPLGSGFNVPVYKAFMDIRHLRLVSLSDITFSYNSIPSISDTSEQAILNMRYIGKLEMVGCKFEYNMAFMGAVCIEYYREFWDIDTSGDQPHLLDTSNDVITVDSCEFTGNTAFNGNGASNGLTISANMPVNIEIKNSRFDGNNSSWNSNGVLQIQSWQLTTTDYTGITEGTNCMKIDPPADDQKAGTCWKPDYMDSSDNEIYYPTGFYLKLTSNTFDSNQTGGLLSIDSWSNVTMTGNTFSNNDKYDYTTACTTGTHATMKKYIDQGLIQTFTNEAEARHFADCTIYGYSVEAQANCSLLISTTNIIGLVVSGATSTVQSNNCAAGTIWQVRTSEQSGFTFENVIFDNNLIQSERGGILQLEHDISYNTLTMGSAQVPEINNCDFTNNSLDHYLQTGGALFNVETTDLVDDEPRIKVKNCTFRNNVGRRGSAINWTGGALIISGSTFEENHNTVTATKIGGAVYFYYNLDTQWLNVAIGEFSCTNCTFRNNIGPNCPDIATQDATADADAFIKWFITGSTFSGTTAETDIGSINMGLHAFKQRGDPAESYISQTTFTNISAPNGGGTLYIRHLIGSFTLTDVTFDGLTSDVFSCGIHGAWRQDDSYNDSSRDHTYVELKNCTVQNCDCGNFAYIQDETYRMHIKTDSLIVQNNQFKFAVVDNGYLTENNSNFSNNAATSSKAQNASVYDGMNTAIAHFTSTTFNYNSSMQKGGAIHICVSGTEAYFTSINASYNSAHKGGFLYATDQASFHIESNSDISNNTADKGSAIFTISCEESTHSIEDTSLHDNIGYGFIFLIEARVEISTSSIHSNVVSDIDFEPSSGMVLIFSEIESRQNTFNNQSGRTGAYLLATSDSTFTDNGSTFTTGNAVVGGIGYIVSTDVYLNNTIVNDISAEYSGFFYMINESSLKLTNVQVSNVNTHHAPALIYNIDSEIAITESSFTNFNSTAFEVTTSHQDLDIMNSNFTNGGNDADILEGGVLKLSNSQHLRAIGNRFTNLTAFKGAGMYFDGIVTAEFTIGENIFTNCTATQGGAIYNNIKKLDLYGNYFFNNFAKNYMDDEKELVLFYGDGGAIYNYCPALNDGDCKSNYSNNTFDYNTADHDGGAVKWNGIEPYNLTTNNTFGNNNTAVYGNNYASMAIQLAVITREQADTGNFDANTAYERQLSDNISLQNVASGQDLGTEIILVLRDQYGQAVTTDETSRATLVTEWSANVSLGGTTSQTAMTGVYLFDDFSVTSSPGTNVTFKISTDGILEGDIGAQQELGVDVSLRQCLSGEIRQGNEATPNDIQCHKCTENTYAIEVNATLCTACLEMAVCNGGNQMHPYAGYWRPHTEYDGFYECLREESCLGHENFTNPLGACATGYKGNLCQSCDENYSRTSKNTCDKCTDPSINGVRLGAIMVLVVIIICVMVRSTLASANKKKEAYSIYFKIFMNYVQLVVLTASFKLNWPEQVQDLLDTQESAGSVTEQLFSFDCYMMEAYPNTAVFFQKLVLILFLPVIMILTGAAVWGLIALNQGSISVLKNQLVTTIIVLFFLAHPIIVKTMFSTFSCMDIDGKYFLYEDLDIECFDDTHTFYSMICALPGMLVWGIASPMLALVLLYRQRRDLDEVPVKMKFGFLYIGYRKGCFIWEFVILYRKIAIVFVSVFLASFNVPVQALTAMFILMIAFYLQEHYEPYETVALNNLEKKSIICSSVTIYCGLYFLTDSLSNNGKLGFFIVILLVNLYFLSTWMIGICHSFVEKAARTKPYLFRRMCHCWTSVWRSAEKKVRQDIEAGMKVDPIDTMFDPPRKFSLEDVDDDMDLYVFIARKRAEARGESTDTDSNSKFMSYTSTIDLTN